MTQPIPGSIVAGPQAVKVEELVGKDRALTPRTATRLRDLCERTGETFDGNLTELQARRRIAALEEVHGIS